MKTDGGVIRDVIPDRISIGNSPYALNRVISKKFQASVNEAGFTELFEYPGTLCTGTIQTDKEYGYHFLIDADSVANGTTPTVCKIVKVGRGINTVIIDDPRLGFSHNKVITGVHDYNYLGEEVIVWVSEGNPPSVLNVDNPTFLLNADKTFQTDSDVKLTKVFPTVETCNIQLKEVLDNGGFLDSATYIFFVAYNIEKGFDSNYVQYSRPVYLYEDSHKESFNQIWGSIGGKTTRKAISLVLTDLDVSYKRVTLSCIKIENGVRTGHRIGSYAYEGTIKSILVTDFENAEDFPIEKLLIDFAEFSSFKTVALSNERIHFGNGVRLTRDIGYSEYAKDIQVNWVYEDPIALKDWSGSYKDEVTIFDKQGFMADEVYALYIGFKLKDGTRSKAYHIPGRLPKEVYANPTSFQENDLISDIAALNNYQTGALDRDKEISPAVRWFHTRETASLDGTMGYWENENEFYSNGDKVRHHKFPGLVALDYWKDYLVIDPSVPPTYDLGDVSIGDYGQRVKSEHITYALGLRFQNIVIPEYIRDKVDSYEIFYAKRDLTNSTVIGQGYTTHVGDYGNFDTYWENDSQAELAGQNKKMAYSFDMLSERANVSIDFIKNYARGDRNTSFLSDPEFPDPAFYPFQVPFADSYIETIKETQFIPGGARIRDHGHAPSYWQGPFYELTATAPSGHTNQPTHSAYFAFKQDVFQNYESQELVSTCIVFKVTTDEVYQILKLYRGDTFTGLFAAYASPAYLTSTNDETCGGLPDIRPVITQGQKNVSLRLDDNDDPQLWNYSFFPKTEEPFLLANPTFQDLIDPLLQPGNEVTYRRGALCWGYVPGSLEDKATLARYRQSTAAFLNDSYAYNGDYSIVFADKPSIVYHPQNITEALLFPNLIIRGAKKIQGEPYTSLRSFLVNDFYEMQRDRGEIIMLMDYGGELYIQCKSSLFKTVSKDTLNTDSVAIYLGTGDIFRAAPQELVPASKGYIGCQNQLGITSSKQGYIVVDTYMGKAFAISNSLNEITGKGMRNWFRDNLKFWFQLNFPEADISYDVPYAQNGFGSTVLYDESENRLIITKVDYQLRDTSLFTAKSLTEIEEVFPGAIIYFADKGLIFRYNSGIIEPVDMATNPEFTDISFTWSYSFDTEEWVGEHSYTLQLPSQGRNYSYSWHRGKYFIHNQGNPGQYYEETFFPFIVDFYVSQEAEETKQIAGVKWSTRVFEPKEPFETESTNTVNKVTFSHMALYNDRQCTGLIKLDPNKNIDAVEQSWKFNEFRDLVSNEFLAVVNPDYSFNLNNIDQNKPWFKRRRLYGKYNVVRVMHNNNQYDRYTIYLLSIEATQRVMI